MVSPSSDVTLLLSELANGNQAAGEKLLPLVYDELKRLARTYMRKERQDHTLQTTALVHEAYLKLVKQQDVNWQGRSHFFGIAAQLMRRILIDHARSRLREKRGGHQEAVTLDETLVFSPERSEELLKLDEALERLSQLDARQGRIVELRFFAGLRLVGRKSLAARRIETNGWGSPLSNGITLRICTKRPCSVIPRTAPTSCSDAPQTMLCLAKSYVFLG